MIKLYYQESDWICLLTPVQFVKNVQSINVLRIIFVLKLFQNCALKIHKYL